ncbi:MAG: ATP-binding protein [Proteobacteria bacterium]|nr:ATP-binding protein [Pseudomonadota bacterium]
MGKQGAELRSQVIFNRYEWSSIVVTTHRALRHWKINLSNNTLASAMIDRLVQPGGLVQTKGDAIE